MKPVEITAGASLRNIKEENVMSRAWIFGIDGGGTSARLRIEAEDGSVLFTAEGGSMNPRSAGWEGARSTLLALFRSCYSQTNLSPSDCLAGCAGIAGIDRPEDTASMEQLVRECGSFEPDTPLIMKNDSIPGLVGAFGELRGILLVAGTGSIAIGASAAGKIVRSGGWGHILGDEGSAYWVGREALNAAIRYHDRRGPETSLLGRALAWFGIKEPFGLIPAVYEQFDKAKIAAFARVVAEAREQGDMVAQQIMHHAADELASLVVSVAIRLGEALSGGRIALSGGFITNNERLWRDTEARILASLPHHVIQPPHADATVGACLLARQAIHPRFGR